MELNLPENCMPAFIHEIPLIGIGTAKLSDLLAGQIIVGKSSIYFSWVLI